MTKPVSDEMKSISFKPVTMTNSEYKKSPIPASIHRLKEQPEESPLTPFVEKPSIEQKREHLSNAIHRKTQSQFNVLNADIIKTDKNSLNPYEEKKSSHPSTPSINYEIQQIVSNS